MLNGGKTKQQITPFSKEKESVISWIPYWDQENAHASFSRNMKYLDFISLFWYKLDSNGNIAPYKNTVEDQNIIDTAHANNVKVIALIANMPDFEEGGSWDHNRVDTVISSKEKREKHIQDLLVLVKSRNYDGLDIDYEALKRYQRENFSLFIEELATALHKEGRVLGVAIHPKTQEFKPEEDNGSHAQDLKRIAKAADQLYLMTYLEHGKHSSPGSSGSLPWIRLVLRYIVEELNIPKEKVFAGIGLFGLQWEKNNGNYTGTHDDITYGEILSIMERTNAPVVWDENSKSSSITYSDNGKEYVIWFDNAESFRHRLQLAKEFGIQNFALWRLNNEDPKIWQILESN